jgi:hypothetical protein
MRGDSRTLATKDERHHLVTKCRPPRFETSRAYKESGWKYGPSVINRQAAFGFLGRCIPPRAFTVRLFGSSGLRREFEEMLRSPSKVAARRDRVMRARQGERTGPVLCDGDAALVGGAIVRRFVQARRRARRRAVARGVVGSGRGPSAPIACDSLLDRRSAGAHNSKVVGRRSVTYALPFPAARAVRVSAARASRTRSASPTARAITSGPPSRTRSAARTAGVARTCSARAWASCPAASSRPSATARSRSAAIAEGLLSTVPHVGSPPGTSGPHEGTRDKREVLFPSGFVVRRDGIEPPTRGFSVPCSTD